MTLIEALQTGLKFKRPHHHQEYYDSYKNDYVYVLRSMDILATDWEVEEEKFEVTEDEIRHMLTRHYSVVYDIHAIVEDIIIDLKKGKYK